MDAIDCGTSLPHCASRYNPQVDAAILRLAAQAGEPNR